jgi:hypothetical protein
MKPLQFKKHTTKGICQVLYCTNECQGKMCGGCRSRKSRLADPVRYAFNNVKGRAARDGIPFTITLEDFRKWCVRVNYIGLKGKTLTGYNIDRRYEDIGYHIDNIACIKKLPNIKKYFFYCWRSKSAKWVEIKQEAEAVEDLPF